MISSCGWGLCRAVFSTVAPDNSALARISAFTPDAVVVFLSHLLSRCPLRGSCSLISLIIFGRRIAASHRCSNIHADSSLLSRYFGLNVCWDKLVQGTRGER